jgi:hypothetical protein
MNGEFELGFVIVTGMVVVLCMLGSAWGITMLWLSVRDGLLSAKIPDDHHRN